MWITAEYMEGSRTSLPLLRDVGRFALESARLIPLGHGLFKRFGFGFWFLEVFCFVFLLTMCQQYHWVYNGGKTNNHLCLGGVYRERQILSK